MPVLTFEGLDPFIPRPTRAGVAGEQQGKQCCSFSDNSDTIPGTDMFIASPLVDFEILAVEIGTSVFCFDRDTVQASLRSVIRGRRLMPDNRFAVQRFSIQDLFAGDRAQSTSRLPEAKWAFLGKTRRALYEFRRAGSTTILNLEGGSDDPEVYRWDAADFAVSDRAGLRRVLAGLCRMAPVASKQWPRMPKRWRAKIDSRMHLDYLVHGINALMLPDNQCPHCGRPSPRSETCPRCRHLLHGGEWFLDGVATAWLYDEKDTLARTIKWFKGHKVRPWRVLAYPLAWLYLRRSLHRLTRILSTDDCRKALVVPVPSAFTAVAARGHDPATTLMQIACLPTEEFVNQASYFLPGIDWSEVAQEIEPVPIHAAQVATRLVRLSPLQRHPGRIGSPAVKLLQGLYRVNGHVGSDRPVVLVDDNMHSGATLNEAARLFKEAGAARVIGVPLSTASTRLLTTHVD